MMSRFELELKSLEELQVIGRKYGIQPIRGYGERDEWIDTITRFPYKAIDQMRDGVGLHSPGVEAYHKNS